MCQGSSHISHIFSTKVSACVACVSRRMREEMWMCWRFVPQPFLSLVLFVPVYSEQLQEFGPLKADRHCSRLRGKQIKPVQNLKAVFRLKEKVCFAVIPFKEAAALPWDGPAKWLSTSFSSIRLFYEDISQRFPGGHLLIKLWPGLHRSFTWIFFKFLFFPTVACWKHEFRSQNTKPGRLISEK